MASATDKPTEVHHPASVAPISSGVNLANPKDSTAALAARDSGPDTAALYLLSHQGQDCCIAFNDGELGPRDKQSGGSLKTDPWNKQSGPSRDTEAVVIGTAKDKAPPISDPWDKQSGPRKGADAAEIGTAKDKAPPISDPWNEQSGPSRGADAAVIGTTRDKASPVLDPSTHAEKQEQAKSAAKLDPVELTATKIAAVEQALKSQDIAIATMGLTPHEFAAKISDAVTKELNAKPPTLTPEQLAKGIPVDDYYVAAGLLTATELHNVLDLQHQTRDQKKRDHLSAKGLPITDATLKDEKLSKQEMDATSVGALLKEMNKSPQWQTRQAEISDVYNNVQKELAAKTAPTKPHNASDARPSTEIKSTPDKPGVTTTTERPPNQPSEHQLTDEETRINCREEEERTHEYRTTRPVKPSAPAN